MTLGAHLSISKGLPNVVDYAKSINCDAFSLFLSNQRRWKSKPLCQKAVLEFRERMKACNISPKCVVPHGSYLVNLATPDIDQRIKSIEYLTEELHKCNELGIPYYNIHPGSTAGKCDLSLGLKYVAESINEIHSKVQNVCILLETAAGQGFSVGKTFEELASIIKDVLDKSRVGICIDTCHIFAAGYDIREEISYRETMLKIENTIGFDSIKAFHLNDSKAPLSSRKDRHENIGKGFIGLEAFRLLMNDKRFENVPKILETPCDDSENSDIYKQEISLLRSLSVLNEQQKI